MGAYIGKTSKKYDVKNEVRILEWWNDSQVYESLKNKLKDCANFFFLDGPPYATNPPHVGTAWNKILKDTLIRYKRMRGYNVRDQPGYDCHGLPIEVKVEEELKIKSKKEIEKKIGVANFISRCKKYAFENAEKQTLVFKNLGIWMDWKNPYMTLEKPYMESIWWTIKKAQENGLLERGLKVVHWCPRCETALAGYEVTDEYKIVEDYSIYVKFPIEDEPNKYILIWTTTPWTLPANVAILVHPDEYYVQVKQDNESYILAESRCSSVFADSRYKIEKRFKGSKIEGLKYKSRLRNVPLQISSDNPHIIVISKDYVSMVEGTGCVHTAPGHGEEDFEVGLEKGLPIYSPVDSGGHFTEKAGKYSGMYVKEADKEIIEDLRKANSLFKETKIAHSYPHCWRCKTPLLMRATEQWFIKVSLFKNKMLEENSIVYWSPEWAGTKRFSDWLKNARDWVISRQRFWGVPLPIWLCRNCGNFKVVGSIKELKECAVGSITVKDLHRDCIDLIKLSCECGSEMYRVPDIIDVWLDSGVASWASLNYPIDGEEYEKWWPADTIIEAHDQTRGWFYTQLGASVICFERAPYKAVLMHGHVLDPKGQKMSKSLGNFIDPLEAASKCGRDSLRMYELQSTTWDDFRFSWNKLEDMTSKLKVIWNVISFASLYMNLDRFNPSKNTLNKVMCDMRPEDKWLISRIEKLKIEVTDDIEKLEFHRAARKITDFAIEDLSHWYVRLVRRRFWYEKESLDKLAAYATLYHALKNWVFLAAPMIPFMAEKAYREMILPAEGELPESVHMNEWPKANTTLIENELERQMSIVKEVWTASLSARQSLNIKLRQPIGRLLIFTDDPKVKKILVSLLNLTLQATNSKKIEIYDTAFEKQIEQLSVLPIYKVLGPKFKGEANKAANALKQVDGLKVKQAISKLGFFILKVNNKTYKVTADMVIFKETMPEGFAGSNFREGRVYVDSRLTEDLLKEGFVQDVVRRIQEMRRQLDLQVDAYIDICIVSKGKTASWILSSLDYIKEEVRAKSLNVSTKTPPKDFYIKNWPINGELLKIGITGS